MIPFENRLLLNTAITNNNGILKTQPVFGFSSISEKNFLKENFHPEAIRYINWITQTPFDKRSLQAPTTNHYEDVHQNRSLSKVKKKRLEKKRRGGKVKNCIIKMFKKKRRRIRRNESKIRSKYVIPFIMGLLVAKTLLIPVALKVLAFISAKGLMMGFFSTALASLLSLKGMFEHGYKERKDDRKTQVEIIQVPSKSDDHIYYDERYTKGGYGPIVY